MGWCLFHVGSFFISRLHVWCFGLEKCKNWAERKHKHEKNHVTTSQESHQREPHGTAEDHSLHICGNSI